MESSLNWAHPAPIYINLMEWLCMVNIGNIQANIWYLDVLFYGFYDRWNSCTLFLDRFWYNNAYKCQWNWKNYIILIETNIINHVIQSYCKQNEEINISSDKKKNNNITVAAAAAVQTNKFTRPKGKKR